MIIPTCPPENSHQLSIQRWVCEGLTGLWGFPALYAVLWPIVTHVTDRTQPRTEGGGKGAWCTLESKGLGGEQ